jgi:3-vinyl bacteriochlorophyllide hydratase
MFTSGVLARILDSIDVSPWVTTVGRHVRAEAARPARQPLYTPEERIRRDSTPWTMVQGILAPLQFLVLLVSVSLVIRYLGTGEGYEAATISIVVKTCVLYAIMITGCIWEKVVFGKYLFARAFFWEDVFSMLVLALHTAYLIVLAVGLRDPAFEMTLALAAYFAYAVNATQFLLKLRAARQDEARQNQRLHRSDDGLGYSR